MDGANAHGSLLSYFPNARSAVCNGDDTATVTYDSGPVGAHCPGCWFAKIGAAVAGFTPPRFRQRVPLLPEVARWAARGREAEGLYLSGQVGTGKTHTAWSALAAWCEAAEVIPKHHAAVGWWADGPGRPNVIFTRMTDLLDDLRPGDASRQRIRDCQEAALLVIDDLGAEKASEWTQERFYSVIDHRYANSLPLIVTSNLPPSVEALGNQAGERAASRLGEMCTVVAMAGDDRRRPTS